MEEGHGCGSVVGALGFGLVLLGDDHEGGVVGCWQCCG